MRDLEKTGLAMLRKTKVLRGAAQIWKIMRFTYRAEKKTVDRQFEKELKIWRDTGRWEKDGAGSGNKRKVLAQNPLKCVGLR